MKNIIIVVLLLSVVGLGYALLRNDSDSTSQDTSTPSIVSSSETLDLSSRGLATLDPALFADNTNVTNLDVSGNQLTGALPAEIRLLSDLQTLDASDNKLTGIPAEIGQLSQLQSADFSNNDISGLPLEISNLNNLKTFDLRGNPNISMYDIELIQKDNPGITFLVD